MEPRTRPGRRWLRRIALTGIGCGLVLGLVAAVVLGPYALAVRHYPPDPAGGYHADFYLYVPAQVEAPTAPRPATLLVQPNNSGTNSDDPQLHRDDAWWTGFGRHGLAEQLGVILLVPAFVRPAQDWKIYTHALDRDALTTKREDLLRPDLQLLAMVDRARADLATQGIATEARFLIQGFSASGMFANRFTALHPDRVKAVAAGSPGGWPIAPATRVRDKDLPYPAGVGDLAELVGQPFDAATYARVPQLIVMGTLDDNDSVDFRDGWDEAPAALVDGLFGTTPMERWSEACRLYEASGANSTFLLVDGIGHDRRALQAHTTEFFARVLGR